MLRRPRGKGDGAEPPRVNGMLVGVKPSDPA